MGKLKMNERAAATVFDFPQTTEMSTDRQSWSWFVRRFHELGVIEMAPSTNKPPGFYLNYSTALFYLTVVAVIAGGFWFTYDRIATANYERGIADAEKRQIEKRMADDKDEQEKKNKALTDEIRILKEKVK